MQGSICRLIQCHQYVIHNLLTPGCQVGQGGLKDQGGLERAWGLELPRGEDGMGGLSLAGWLHAATKALVVGQHWCTMRAPTQPNLLPDKQPSNAMLGTEAL